MEVHRVTVKGVLRYVKVHWVQNCREAAAAVNQSYSTECL